jgi:predicted component of type VI protein secretion system
LGWGACGAQVSGRHAVVEKSGGDFWLKEVACDNGGPTWLNGKKMQPGSKVRIIPGDLIEFGAREVEATTFRVKACHVSVREQLDRKASGEQSSERELAVV